MIALLILIGGVIWLGLFLWFGQWAVVAFAALLAAVSVYAVLSDLRRHHHGRATAVRRFRRMRSNDALNRILDGKLRRG